MATKEDYLEPMCLGMNYHKWIYDIIEPYLGHKVCDVGAGLGTFSRLLSDRDLIIVEIDEERNKTLRDQFQTVSYGCLEHTDEDNFDSIVYINVLEHILHDDAELSVVYRKLKPGGYVVIFVPALSMLFSKFDRDIGHCRRYGKRLLKNRIEQARFELVDLRYFDFFGIFPWLIVYKFLRFGMVSSHVRLYDKVVPVFKYFESLFKIPVGKNLIAIGKKEDK